MTTTTWEPTVGRNLINFDPNLVYPPNNLPGSSANWGRSVEDDLIVIKKKIQQVDQETSGQNRHNAAVMVNLAETVATLSDTVTDLSTVTTKLNGQITQHSTTFSTPVLDSVNAYPLTDRTWDISSPSWATRGTLLSGWVTRGGSLGTSASPDTLGFYLTSTDLWNSNAPVWSLSASGYWSGAAGFMFDVSQDHYHPSLSVSGGVISFDVRFSMSTHCRAQQLRPP